MTRLLLVVAALVVVLAAAGVGAGAELQVNPGESIQDAIGDAEPGDTIYVHAGTYVENVAVGKRLALVGDGADVVTVRAASSTGRVFEMTENSVNISGFTVTGANDGIRLIDADHCNIFENDVSNNRVGICLESSCNNILANNTVNSNKGIGIQLQGSSSNTLINNNASNNEYGIRLSESSSNVLTGNVMSGNAYNFGVFGNDLSAYVQNIDMSNRVDRKPIYYWVSQQNRQIPDDAGFVGIVNSTNTTVKDLILENNAEGVLFAHTSNSRIENITASNNWRGIFVCSSISNTLINNNASNNDYGICLWSSNSNMLQCNNVNSNNRDGIYLGVSSSNTLQDNNASNNRDGIRFWVASSNTLTNNTASSNNDNGIYLRSSSDNTLANNNLIDNTPYNAYDTGTNQWDSGSAGNYYSDYNGTDNNTDGIGDTHHPIPGGTSIDRFPLIHPWTGDTPQKGDLNGDSILTPADAAIALRLAASGAHGDAADVSGDGCVTSLDALMILQAAGRAIEL